MPQVIAELAAAVATVTEAMRTWVVSEGDTLDEADAVTAMPLAALVVRDAAVVAWLVVVAARRICAVKATVLLADAANAAAKLPDGPAVSARVVLACAVAALAKRIWLVKAAVVAEMTGADDASGICAVRAGVTVLMPVAAANSCTCAVSAATAALAALADDCRAAADPPVVSAGDADADADATAAICNCVDSPALTDAEAPAAEAKEPAAAACWLNKSSSDIAYH
jgi:hypothetical protein